MRKIDIRKHWLKLTRKLQMMCQQIWAIIKIFFSMLCSIIKFIYKIIIERLSFIDLVPFSLFLIIFGSYRNVILFSISDRVKLVVLFIVYIISIVILFLSNLCRVKKIGLSKFFSIVAFALAFATTSVYINILSKPFLNSSNELFFQGGITMLFLFVILYFSPQYIVSILGRFIKFNTDYYKYFNKAIKIILTVLLIGFSVNEVDIAYKEFLVEFLNYPSDIIDVQNSFVEFSRKVYIEGVLVFLMLNEIVNIEKAYNKNQKLIDNNAREE